jgi:hypothetical protein
MVGIIWNDPISAFAIEGAASAPAVSAHTTGKQETTESLKIVPSELCFKICEPLRRRTRFSWSGDRDLDGLSIVARGEQRAIGRSASSFACHRCPPAMIRHAVWLYVGSTRKFRDVEDLFADRGLDNF